MATLAYISLKELDRRSICCHGPVEHPYPIDAQPFYRCEILRCVICGREIDDFEVVNECGQVIWPVPEWFEGDFSPTYRALCDGSSDSCEVRLPPRLRRALSR